MPRIVKLDATGVKCPIPVIRTRRCLVALAPGDILEVSCTDPMADIDIPCLLFKTGDRHIETLSANGVLIIRIEKS